MTPNTTIGEAIAALGVEERPGEEIILANFNHGRRHMTLAEAHNEPLAPNTFLATGRFVAGRVRNNTGRTAENVASVFALVLDCDVKDKLAMKAEEVHALPADELEKKLQELLGEVGQVARATGLRPNYIVATGYGFTLWYLIAENDQANVERARRLYKRLVAAFNLAAGRRMADPQASDAGTRLMRLAGAPNTKAATPRETFMFDGEPEPWTHDRLEERVADVEAAEDEPAAPELIAARRECAPTPIDLDPSAANEIVGLVRPYWSSGQRHELALGLSGWLKRNGVSQSMATSIIDACAGDDDERADRLKTVETTYAKADAEVAGWSKICGILPPLTVRRIDDLLTAFWRARQPAAPPQTEVVMSGKRQDAASAISAPTFPVEVLPSPVRSYVEAAAASLNVPVEMVAVPLVGLAGSLIGNRLHLLLKDSYPEYSTLYLAIVAPPGAAKTPALKLAKRPLDVLQERALAAYREQMADHEPRLDAWKTEGRKLGERKPVRPELRHYFSTDLTVEALVGMLHRSPGVAVIHDEIAGWINSMDQYKAGKGADRQQFLSLWSGGAIKVDRKGVNGSGETLYVPHPVACVVGGIQPDFVGTLHDSAQRRDGFVERILPIVPDVRPASWSEAAPSDTQFQAVLDIFERLDQIDRFADLTVAGIAEVESGIAVRLSNGAKAAWIDWFDENMRLVESARGTLAAGFYSKLPAHLARLALILHALWLPDDPRPMVSAERMHDAIEVIEFFRAHIHRFLELLQAAAPDRTAGVATRILRILRNVSSEHQAGWVRRSDIFNRLRNVTPADLDEGLHALASQGQIERRVVKTATKPAEEWRLVIAGAVAGHGDDSDYSDYSADAA